MREMLLRPTPETLEDCGPVLEEAAGLMSGIEPSEVQGLRPELDKLRRELSVVSALMQQAAGFYFDWSQILGAAIGGYAPHGRTMTVPSAGRISMEG